MTTYSEGEATGASATSHPIGWEHDTTLKEGNLAIARERLVDSPLEPAVPYQEDNPKDTGII